MSHLCVCNILKPNTPQGGRAGLSFRMLQTADRKQKRKWHWWPQYTSTAKINIVLISAQRWNMATIDTSLCRALSFSLRRFSNRETRGIGQLRAKISKKADHNDIIGCGYQGPDIPRPGAPTLRQLWWPGDASSEKRRASIKDLRPAGWGSVMREGQDLSLKVTPRGRSRAVRTRHHIAIQHWTLSTHKPAKCGQI